jgi:hypothetical protein
MKLILKTTVVDRILERIADARRRDREPDCIVITPEEQAELHHDRRIHTFVERESFYRVDPGEPISATSVMVTRDFERTSGYSTYDRCYGGRYLRCMTREKFMGIPVYVVPLEFHPA